MFKRTLINQETQVHHLETSSKIWGKNGVNQSPLLSKRRAPNIRGHIGALWLARRPKDLGIGIIMFSPPFAYLNPLNFNGSLVTSIPSRFNSNNNLEYESNEHQAFNNSINKNSTIFFLIITFYHSTNSNFNRLNRFCVVVNYSDTK